MLPELGHFCLILTLCLALIQSVLPFWHARSIPSTFRITRSLAYGQLFFVACSISFLAFALIQNDFSVAYVAQNSNTHLPLLYRFCAIWGAHEGSLLLWLFILNSWGAAVATFSKGIPPEISSKLLSVLAVISLGFLIFILFTSNPFSRLLPFPPIEGRDLNPLLQDPGLAIHPPILYLGYVGFSVAFAFAMATLIEGRLDANWARWARPWTLIAWSFLTFGITLGSWWAYRVLGWGGWWFWDPVENASFLPWLSGTALIHSLRVAEKRDTFKAWTLLLAICTFSLSLLGTFLVRSGILVSVHAFAVDPARGAFILTFLAIVVGGSLVIYAFRGHKLQNSGVFQIWSRETFLLTNNVLLMVGMMTVLLGTLYPLIIDLVGMGKLSVGSPYFNAVFIPLMCPVLLLMAIAPAIHWQESKAYLVMKRFKLSFILACLLAVVLPIVVTGEFHFEVALGLCLAFWVIIATIQTQIQDLQRSTYYGFTRLGMVLAHLGCALCVLGIVLSSAFSIHRDVRMQPEDQLIMGPYTVLFQNASALTGPNYKGYRGHFLIQEGKHQTVLMPELRVYDTQKMAVAKTAIKVKPMSDLYIALGDPLEKAAWSVRVYYKPFVRWIWAGGIMMLIGGLFAAFNVRSRQR